MTFELLKLFHNTLDKHKNVFVRGGQAKKKTTP